MNNYKIKIDCTSNSDLSYKNEEFPGEIYNKLNYDKLIHTDFIDKTLLIHKALILHKTITTKDNKTIKTKSLEFICNNEISIIDFETFIKAMQTFGFSSNNHNTIHLIRIHTNEPDEKILSYRFQSITQKKIKHIIRHKNKSTYSTQFLYKNNYNLSNKNK